MIALSGALHASAGVLAWRASSGRRGPPRATEVVKHLVTRAGVPAARLSASGRADTAPVASNLTEAGRRQNRRIEIILLPAEGESAG